jgi:hypothetical protein
MPVHYCLSRRGRFTIFHALGMPGVELLARLEAKLAVFAARSEAQEIE